MTSADPVGDEGKSSRRRQIKTRSPSRVQLETRRSAGLQLLFQDDSHVDCRIVGESQYSTADGFGGRSTINLPALMSFRPPKGTDDIGAPESNLWRDVLGEWEKWADLFGYPLVSTPIFEATELFERGVGSDTEVVTKQMYTFTDRGGRSLTLRPEGTAGVVRAFLDSGDKGPWKGSYSGPMFRHERPQAGRRRQFWQVGVEYLDVEGPAADAEVIELGYRFLTAVEVPAWMSSSTHSVTQCAGPDTWRPFGDTSTRNAMSFATTRYRSSTSTRCGFSTAGCVRRSWPTPPP